MQLSSYLRVLWRRRITVLATLLVALLVGVTATALATPLYTARTQLFVAIGGAGNTGDLVQGDSFARARLQSYAQLVTSRRVLQPVIDELGLQTDSYSLASRMTVNAPLDTVLIDIAVADPNPRLATNIANAVAQSMVTVAPGFDVLGQGNGSDAVPRVDISVVDDAQVPTYPSSPNSSSNQRVALLLGLVLAVALAFVRERLDGRLLDPQGVADVVGAEPLGEVPFDKALGVPGARVAPSTGRSMRRLQGRVSKAVDGGRVRSLLVTSALPGEGRTTVVAALAQALHAEGSRVLVVDASSGGRLAELAGCAPSPGLGDVLDGRCSLDDAVVPWSGVDPGLDVLPGGVRDASSSLPVDRLVKLVRTDLDGAFDVVLLDGDDLLGGSAAAAAACRAVDAVVLVAASGKVRRAEVRQAVQVLDDEEAAVLGVVVNGRRVPERRADKLVERQRASAR